MSLLLPRLEQRLAVRPSVVSALFGIVRVVGPTDAGQSVLLRKRSRSEMTLMLERVARSSPLSRSRSSRTRIDGQ